MQHLLNQVITISTEGGLDDFGDSYYASPLTVQCRFTKVNKVLVYQNGQNEPIDAVIDVMGDVSVTSGDKIVYLNEVFKAMKVTEAIGSQGKVHHRRIEAQKWLT